MPIHRVSNRLALASLITGGLLLAAPSAVSAGDLGCGADFFHGADASCGIEDACDRMPMMEPACGFDAGCDSPTCGCKSKRFSLSRLHLPKFNMKMPKINMKRTMPYQALDSVAGGIEKVLGLDRCRTGCTDSVCDDGCDAAMMDELFVPMPPQMNHYAEPIRTHAAPSYAPIRSHGAPVVNQPYSESIGDPIESTPPTDQSWQDSGPTVAPRTQMRMGESSIDSPTPRAGSITAPLTQPPTQSRDSSPRIAPKPNSINGRDESPIPAPPIPDDSEGSLFDSLSDPFGNDEVRVRRFQPVRPSSYEESSGHEQSGSYESARGDNGSNELSRSTQTSSRRVRKP